MNTSQKVKFIWQDFENWDVHVNGVKVNTYTEYWRKLQSIIASDANGMYNFMRIHTFDGHDYPYWFDIAFKDTRNEKKADELIAYMILGDILREIDLVIQIQNYYKDRNFNFEITAYPLDKEMKKPIKSRSVKKKVVKKKPAKKKVVKKKPVKKTTVRRK